MSFNCPCTRDCPNRNAECHAHCEEYKKYEVQKHIEYKERWEKRCRKNDSIELYYARLRRLNVPIRRS